jgi:predicted methyltransferase
MQKVQEKRKQWRNPVVFLSVVTLLAACGGESKQEGASAPAAMEDGATKVMESAPSQAAPREELIAAAVAHEARPESDLAQDAGRKPAEVLAFAAFEPGDVVADIGASRGYYTRLVSGVVGEEGLVYAFNPQEVADMFFKDGNPSDAVAADYTNVVSIVAPFSKPEFERPLDAVMIVKFYHDSHYDKFATDTATMNETIFEQLKPGGTYLIIDHAAEPGSGLRDVGTMHRIDAELVREEVTAAGFEFVAESDLLANPDDDHSKGVFDASVRGQTDRFILKFRKPGAS